MTTRGKVKVGRLFMEAPFRETGKEGRNCQGTRAGRKNIDKSFLKRQDRNNLNIGSRKNTS
jgi:hypothetical protein